MNQDRHLRAQQADAADPLAGLRDRFCIPHDDSGAPLSYFCGNSLGLMPKRTPDVLAEELEAWGRLAVDGHFEGARPWYRYHEQFRQSLATLLGARDDEVVVMNSLTTNLHLMLTCTYRPAGRRNVILMLDGEFPSDRYAAQSQVLLHGLDPDACIRVCAPARGEDLIDDDALEASIRELGDRLAVVLVSAVHFATGQRFALDKLASAAHDVGAMIGVDLAHAAGNVALSLHDDEVDFAVGCTYKYLNAGPGATGFCFVHRGLGDDVERPRMAGWWGNDPDTRFAMDDRFHAVAGADGFQLSNAPVFSMAPLVESLAIFAEAGEESRWEKTNRLSQFLVDETADLDGLRLVTPQQPERRGAQLSYRVTAGPDAARRLQKQLQQRGFITDYRSPDILRLAPVPLYNTFAEVAAFAGALEELSAG